MTPPVETKPLLPADIDALPSSAPDAVIQYGEDPLQFGELRLPQGRGPFPVGVVIHGGCWTKGYATLGNTAPIASALSAKGLATWNIEYRQVGDLGGGWPGTFHDWGSAVDYIHLLAKMYDLDLQRTFAVGHSAGALAALWVAGRHRLGMESEIRGMAPLEIRVAFAIDGPADLVGLVGPDVEICGKSVVAPLMGGTPLEWPERYAQASPQLMLPFGTRQFLVASEVLTESKAREYETVARIQGDEVSVLVLDTGHFEVIAPGRAEWDKVEKVILENIP